MSNENIIHEIKRIFWISLIVEVLGIVISCIGIGYEIAYQADLGFIIISLGSVMIALGSVLFAKFRPWIVDIE